MLPLPPPTRVTAAAALLGVAFLPAVASPAPPISVAEGDGVIAFCRPDAGEPDPASGRHCACSLQGIETLLGADAATSMLLAMWRGGAVSRAELAAFGQQRDAACGAEPRVAAALASAGTLASADSRTGAAGSPQASQTAGGQRPHSAQGLARRGAGGADPFRSGDGGRP